MINGNVMIRNICVGEPLDIMMLQITKMFIERSEGPCMCEWRCECVYVSLFLRLNLDE